MNDERQVVWAFAALCALIVVVAGWSTVKPGLCEGDLFISAVANHQATWCFEFWLNRYQTLTAALVAFAVAAATGVLLYLQWREARSQGAYYRRLVLEENRHAISTLIDYAGEVYMQFDHVISGMTRLLSEPQWFDQATGAQTINAVGELRAKTDQFEKSAVQWRLISPFEEALAFVRAAHEVMRLVEPRFRGQTDVFLHEPEKQRSTLDTIRKAGNALDYCYMTLMSRLTAAEKKVAADVVKAANEIRV